nr:nodulin-like, major facilitator superfamily domain protein [Tanacetum cinerariifolium]
MFALLYILAAVTGLYLFLLDTQSQNIFIVGILLLVLPFVIPKIVYGLKKVQNVEGPGYNLVEMNNYNELLEERSSSIGAFNMLLEKDRLTELGEEHSARMLVARCDFWLYYVAYLCGGTIGLVYSNNLGQICQSLGYGLETEELVTIYSTCSFFGRLISAVPDLSSCFYTPQMNTMGILLLVLPFVITKIVYGLKRVQNVEGPCYSLVEMNNYNELLEERSSSIGSLVYGVLGGVIYDNNIKSSNEMVFVGGSRAKYPALSFKKQLTDLLMKIYGMIRDNLKKELSPFIGLCILAPKTSRETLVKGHPHANAVAQQTPIAHWHCIVNNFENYFETMKANFVTPFLVRKVFTQIFSLNNVQLFNSLLLRRECCTFSNAEYVQAGLTVLERWCWNTMEEYAGTAWDELKHIRQAVELLVTHQKPKITLKKVIKELCPVISSMRVMMREDMNNGVSSSFLLDDESSIPFNVDEMSKSMPQVDIGDIEFPPLIRKNSCFTFLLQQTEL